MTSHTTTTETTDIRTLVLYAHEVAATRERVAHFNALAVKHNLDVRAEVVVVEETREYTTAFGTKATETVYRTHIEGARLVLPGGFELAGTLDIDAAGNIVRTNPHFDGAEIPSEFRTISSARCDACNTTRDRKKSVIVWSETEGFKIIGTNCVAPYLGIDPEMLMRMLDDVSIDEFDGALGMRRALTVSEFVQAAAIVTLTYGFTPKSAEFGTPTVGIVQGLIRGGGKDFFRDYPALQNISDETLLAAETLAAESLEWIAQQTAGNDYIANLRTAAAREEVGKNDGLLCSLPNAYRRSLVVAAEKAAKVQRPVCDEWLGTEGGKIEVAGSVVFTDRGEPFGGYGPESLFVIFVTTEGATVTLSTTVATVVGQALEALGKDEVVRLAGTVKAHKTNRKGQKVTALTRAKVIG